MNEKQTQMIEDARPEIKDIAALFSWSENYDYPTPATLFLDLIGYSDENFGEPMFDLNQVSSKLGYLELGMLGSALNQFAETPSLGNDFVNALMAADVEEEEEAIA